MDSHIRPVPMEKANRLINHGPTVLVSAGHGGVDNVMAAAWVCGLDFAPPKVTLVLGRTSKTRELAEKSGHLVVQVPTVRQANGDDARKARPSLIACTARKGMSRSPVTLSSSRCSAKSSSCSRSAAAAALKVTG